MFVSRKMYGGILCSFLLALAAPAQTYPPLPIVKDGTAVLLTNYASLPLSGRGGSITSFGSNVATNNQLGRVNFLRSEPASAPMADVRFFVNDLNRNLYILTKSNRAFTSYINFQAVFRKFDNDPGFAGGLVTFAFDPGYSTNGIFYTVHTEDPGISGSAVPTNSNLPGLITNGYTTTTVINPPAGSGPRQAVLVEWTDTNINNATFEGPAREIIRIGFNSNIHPLGDLIFNPLAQPGDEDYRALYIAVGDGGAGETATNSSQHYIPQRLDALQGKILRIIPDLNLRTNTSIVSANGRYRIPASGVDPNPFVNTNGAFGEIFTIGHRNPHRFNWDAVTDQLLVFEIGLTSFEEINVIHKGDNYGYSEREGTKQLTAPGGSYGAAPPGYALSDLPNPDTLPVRITNNPTSTMVPVRYAAAEYFQTEGDAIANGFIYRGALMPWLRGKCVFGDITTGRLFYCDASEMAAADDMDPATQATIQELQVVFDSPHDVPDQGNTNRRIFDIVAEEYTSRGGNAGIIALPGGAQITGGNDPDGIPYGGGRSDIRIAQGGDGELYLLSKSDGLIRQFVATPRPIIATISPGQITWNSALGWVYRLQYKTNLSDPGWTDVVPDITAGSTSTTNSLPASVDLQRFYRVRTVP